jgi:hypothetical protein
MQTMGLSYVFVNPASRNGVSRFTGDSAIRRQSGDTAKVKVKIKRL